MEMHTQKTKVSVVIPVHNGGKDFHRCLTSLSQAIPSPEEVIVVANGDTDSSWSVAQEFGVTVIRIPTAVGPAKARNCGAKAAEGDILLFVDADVEIHTDTIGQVKSIFESQKDLDALIGSYDEAPGAENFLSQYKNLFHHYTHQNSSEEASTFWGACGAIRREVFLKIGGFDEGYRLPSVEDIELGYRLKRAGYKIGLFKDIQVKHLKRWGVISMLKADFFYRALPWTALLLRLREISPQEFGQFSNDLNLKWSSRISVILVYTWLGALVAAWWWFPTLIAVGIVSLLLLVINRPVYQFFHSKRSLFFTIKTIPWHWLYYFYSGLALAVGIIRHLLQRHQTLVSLP